MGQAAPPPATTVEAIQVMPARLPDAASDAVFSIIELDREQVEDFQRLDQALGLVGDAVQHKRAFPLCDERVICVEF